MTSSNTVIRTKQPSTQQQQQQQQQRRRRRGLLAHQVRSHQDDQTGPPAGVEFEELHGESFWDVLGEQPENQLNVVICYTSKCMPCKMAKPVMASWEDQLVGEQGKRVKMFQFALTLPNKECALGMDVRSSPTFLVIRDGEIVSRGKGKAALEEIKDFVYQNACT